MATHREFPRWTTQVAHAPRIHYQYLIALAIILGLTVLPVTLAARFANAKRPGFLASAIAVVLGGIASDLVLWPIGTTFAALGLAFLATCAVYAVVLRVSLAGAVGVTVIAFFLQVVFTVALVSFGLHLQGINP